VRLLVALLVLVVAPPAVMAEPCRVTAVLEGDRELVDSTSRSLSRRGVATTPTAACPSARARLDRRGSAIAVTVIDPDGRRSERVLADLDAAASLIESWARQDLNAGLLFGWTVDAPPPAAPPIAIVAQPTAPRRAPRFLLVAAGELGRDFDGATWTGGRLHGCVRVGFACLGAIGRIASAAPRRNVDVIGAIDIPLALGRRVVLSPGAGLGTGWFTTEVGDARTPTTANSLRLDGHLTLAVALGRRVAFHAGLSVGMSPSAPAQIDGGEAPRFLDEPTGSIRGELGLRIGVP
jgi:hypothetical protein